MIEKEFFSLYDFFHPPDLIFERIFKEMVKKNNVSRFIDKHASFISQQKTRRKNARGKIYCDVMRHERGAKNVMNTKSN